MADLSRTFTFFSLVVVLNFFVFLSEASSIRNHDHLPSKASNVPFVKCNKELDLAILVDSSSSISRESFGIMKSFIKALISRFAIGPRLMRLSIVPYSTFAKTELMFNTLSERDWNQATVNTFIHTISQTGGLNFIDRALDVTDRVVFAKGNGMRPSSKKVVMLITDGPQTKRFHPYQPLYIPSKSLRSKGVQMYAVGVGPAVNARELKTITSTSRNIFLLNSFRELMTKTSEIGSRFC